MNFDKDYIVPGVLVSILVASIVLVIMAAIYSTKENMRLINLCIADGRKEYECKAMFKSGGGGVQTIPIYRRY